MTCVGAVSGRCCVMESERDGDDEEQLMRRLMRERCELETRQRRVVSEMKCQLLRDILVSHQQQRHSRHHSTHTDTHMVENSHHWSLSLSSDNAHNLTNEYHRAW